MECRWCGCLIRVIGPNPCNPCHPFGLVFADDVDVAEGWSVDHSKLTHRDPTALAASAAMVQDLDLQDKLSLE